MTNWERGQQKRKKNLCLSTTRRHHSCTAHHTMAASREEDQPARREINQLSEGRGTTTHTRTRGRNETRRREARERGTSHLCEVGRTTRTSQQQSALVIIRLVSALLSACCHFCPCFCRVVCRVDRDRRAGLLCGGVGTAAGDFLAAMYFTTKIPQSRRPHQEMSPISRSASSASKMA